MFENVSSCSMEHSWDSNFLTTNSLHIQRNKKDMRSCSFGRCNSNPLPRQSGCYVSSAHLNNVSLQLQHQTSAPQHKNNTRIEQGGKASEHSFRLCFTSFTQWSIIKSIPHCLTPMIIMHIMPWYGAMHIKTHARINLFTQSYVLQYCWSSGSIFIKLLRITFKCHININSINTDLTLKKGATI